MTTYLTRDGDVVDRIAWERFGDVQAAHAILAANPVLADHGPTLPAGIALILPSPSGPQSRRRSVRLWGIDR